jgi:acyl-CoA thioesterase
MVMNDSKPALNKEDGVQALKAKIQTEPIASFLNIKILELSPGYAKISLKMRPEYLNFNGVVFGSIVMAAADYAFALAINSLHLPSLATQFNIHLLAPTAAEDELFSEAKVVRSGRKVGVTEMTVTNQKGKLIAKATGTTIPITEEK